MEFKYDNKREKFILLKSDRIEHMQLSIHFKRKVKGYRHKPKYKFTAWDGSGKDFFKGNEISLGLWKEIVKASKIINKPLKIKNKENFPLNRDIKYEDLENFCYDFFKHHKVIKDDGTEKDFMPYEHQIRTAYKILKNRYCCAEVATSGGKSLAMTIIILYTLYNIEKNAKTLIIVPSIQLVTQFYDGILEYYYGQNILKRYENNMDDINEHRQKLYDEGKTKYPPLKLNIEEIMSDKPRKYNRSNPNIFIGTYQSLEKQDKKFFKQFHTVMIDEGHKAKAPTIKKIMEKTFCNAYSRVGLSGTFPEEDTDEILTIQYVTGPIITEVTADELKKKGIISKMLIKPLILNHNDLNYESLITKTMGKGFPKEALELEKEYIHASKKRMDIITKIINQSTQNSLILFNTIEYGKKILEHLKENVKDKKFFYIDGDVKNKERNRIKHEMEKTKEKVEYTILNFGEYEIELKSDFKILLTNGKYKKASDINRNDDIDDNFINKLRKNI